MNVKSGQHTGEKKEKETYIMYTPTEGGVHISKKKKNHEYSR